jgi:hypothetical protein
VRRLALAAAAALALGACYARRPVPQTTEGDWAQARDGASRRRFLYDGFDHRATATATHLSLAVREARARRLAVWFGWTAEELEKRLAQERKEAAEGEEFVISLYTAQPRQNDLDAPRSIWRVAVKLGEADLLAKSVTAVDRDATVHGLFPYVGPFDVVYRAVFPLAPGGPLGDRRFVLQLASALGKMDLKFNEPNGAGPAQPEEAR